MHEKVLRLRSDLEGDRVIPHIHKYYTRDKLGLVVEYRVGKSLCSIDTVAYAR